MPRKKSNTERRKTLKRWFPRLYKNQRELFEALNYTTAPKAITLFGQTGPIINCDMREHNDIQDHAVDALHYSMLYGAAGLRLYWSKENSTPSVLLKLILKLSLQLPA